MFSTPTAEQVFACHLVALQRTLPLVREHEPDAIHDARVAVRRLRAVLPLVTLQGIDAVDAFGSGLRSLGRALGRVRDLDVSIALLAEFERRVPLIVPVAAPIRQRLETDAAPARRALVKALERDQTRGLIGGLHTAAMQHVRARRIPTRWLRPGVAARVLHHTAQHGERLRTAIEHAGGVYFPNRVHAVRIAAKKLRYVVEIANATGVWRADAELQALRRSQELLGQIHDRQVLLDLLDADAESAGPGDEATGTAGSPASDDRREVFARLLRADRDELHRRYVARRPELLAVCAAARRLDPIRRRGRVRTSLVACGVAALPAAVRALGHRQR